MRAVGLFVGGVGAALAGKQDRGFTLIAFAVIFGGLLLVLRLSVALPALRERTCR